MTKKTTEKVMKEKRGTSERKTENKQKQRKH